MGKGKGGMENINGGEKGGMEVIVRKVRWI